MFDSNKLELELAIGRLKVMVDQQNNTIREWWRNFEELRKKVNGLYGTDTHDTERPKVDMLSDTIDNEVWKDICELRNRIFELEKKK